MIRRMKIDDIVQVYNIETLSFAHPWSKDAFYNELLVNNTARYYVYVDKDSNICAYMGLWKILDEGHITNIAVMPEKRGKGYGKALIDRVIDLSKREGITRFTLEVRVGNIPAISLYKSFGFKEAGIRKKYYEDNNEDALIMWHEAEV